MRQLVVGLLAHVDAGKTTLAEALLYTAGAIRVLGRVDHGDSHLDVAETERRRGITIFSNQATLTHEDTCITLVDAPGHVDFSAEAERTLQALDCAVLVVGANDGIQGHTRTMWRLLEERNIPTLVFVNKMDLAGADAQVALGQLQARLSPGCVDFTVPDDPDVLEAAAMTDEAALDEFLETGGLSLTTLRDMVLSRRLHPCVCGSALKLEGVDRLLDLLASLACECEDKAQGEFGARVFKVSHGSRGERISWLKVTSGELRAKSVLTGTCGGRPWSEKVDQLRVCEGVRMVAAPAARAGQLCAVTGLSHVAPGDVLGCEPTGIPARLVPVLTYRVELGECDVHAVLAALRTLADEDPVLGVTWNEQLQELHLRLMGEVQLEVVREALQERFGLAIDFGPGGICYQETISAPVVGVGHFEPLRHYAEAHLMLEPLPAGSGVVFGSCCSEDDLDRNWQRLILTNAMERDHLGVLVGAPLTDVRITLVAGRAHLKHTEGGDFRQATYRAIRQGLMLAREAGACVLLEPWYRFVLEVPSDRVGRALTDLQRMSASFGAPEQLGEMAQIEGTVPVSEIRSYALDVAAYTRGQGSLQCELLGYEPCHEAERVIVEVGYDPEADLPNTPDSVFCSHGAGYTVKWHEVRAHMHVDDETARRTPWRAADAAFFGS
ncbi:MAG: GTP-binding protein [Atopobiaceae bacterium]|nr:GTP-binding protein [Atopobiaceae bacterium]